MKLNWTIIKDLIFDWRVVIALGVISFCFFAMDSVLNGDNSWTWLSETGFWISIYISAIVVSMIVGMIVEYVIKLIKKWKK